MNAVIWDSAGTGFAFLRMRTHMHVLASPNLILIRWDIKLFVMFSIFEICWTEVKGMD